MKDEIKKEFNLGKVMLLGALSIPLLYICYYCVVFTLAPFSSVATFSFVMLIGFLGLLIWCITAICKEFED
jgi:hypothetical protein